MSNTQYAVCHLQRGSGNDSGMSCHIERKDAKGKKYVPDNADAGRTHLNRELVKFPDGVSSRTEAIQHRINTAGLRRKVGKNQTKAIRIILTGTHEQMMKIANGGRLDCWIEANLKWLRDAFGNENLVSCVLHMDEKTPHLHATIVPIVTGERVRRKREGEKKYETKSGPRLSADDVTDQASWQAYLSLTMSSVEGIIRLPKKAILIMPDAVSTFETDAVSVEETADHDLTATEKKVTVRNKIWDGQAMLDISVFEENGYADYGMVLLRNRFFKTCAFNTNLQDWFFDNDITQVSRLAGYTTARDIKDIKLVITESSVKYFKFMPKDMPFEQKCKRFLDALYEGKNSSVFGVVKADHDAPLMDGMMAYTNYQLLNTIGLTREGVGKLLEPSFEYLQDMLNRSPFLRYQINMTTDHATIAENEVPDLANTAGIPFSI